MNQTAQLGLISAQGSTSLLGVTVSVEAHDYSSLVRVRQRYMNQEPIPIEATYLFPLEDGAAIHEFNVYTRDDVYRGAVMEREEAFEAYDDAIGDGHGAYLLDQERANVFTASVGNLAPQQEVIIELVYVAQVPAEGEGARLSIPTVVAPRYVPSETPSQAGDQTPSDAPHTPRELGMDEDERWNEPRWPRVPYGLDLSVKLTLSGGLAEVSSPSHPIHTRFVDSSDSTSNGTSDSSSAVVTLSRDDVALDRDVVITYTPKRREASALLVRDDRGSFIGVNFTPPAEGAHQPAEVICLLDCSASMGGDSIDQAKRSLSLLLRGLEEGDTFNLYYFGSRHESLWERSQPYTQENLERALSDLERRGADLGGTALMEPLRAITKELANRGQKRDQALDSGHATTQLVLLTDGHISNEREVVKLCEEHKRLMRIFTFGIGDGVSESLVRDLARVTYGSVEMVGSGERIEPKVLRMYGRLHQPHLTLTEIDWGGLNVERATEHKHALYLGDLFTMYARLRDLDGESGSSPASLESLPDAITLRSGERAWEVPLSALPDATSRADGSTETSESSPESNNSKSPIPILWAREVIRELERFMGNAPNSEAINPRRKTRRHDRARAELIELAKTFSLMSSATSFVAIEERSAEERSSSREPELRKIPLAKLPSQRSSGWGGGGHPLSSLFAGSFVGSFAGRSYAIYHSNVAQYAPSAPAQSALSKLASPPPMEYRFESPSDHLSDVMYDKISSPLSSPEPEAHRTDPRDVVFAYLSLQRADGSFEWTGRDRSLPIELSPEVAGEITDEMQRSHVFMTRYVLLVLRTQYQAHYSLWARAEKKAERFLSAAGDLPDHWTSALETIRNVSAPSWSL